MWLGPFLRRELTTSVRGSRAFGDRRNAAFLTAIVVLGSFLLWDWQEWDRTSIVGSHRFGLATFGLLASGMALLAMGIAGSRVALAIASERDRKSLDALLASEFSSVEIVLGVMAAGLFRIANALAAPLPVVVLMVFLGGVSPAWVVLAGIGLASVVVLMVSFAVVASVESRTGARAVNLGSGLFALWALAPTLFLVFRPWLWPGAPSWLTSAVVAIGDGSPLGLMSNLGGIIPRPGGPVEAVLRMAAWQVGGSLALVAWAIARLRPASRGLYDVEGQATRLRMLRAAMRRPPRRPACYDDPVLWYEMHAARTSNLVMRLLGRAIGLAWLGFLALVTWWLARPAFSELIERGYGPSREAFTMPEVNPFVRLVINKAFTKLTMNVAPGQARLEFNIALRQSATLFVMAYIATAISATVESVKGERRRDTWLGLIATPLTGREILRAKMLGSFWKARESAFTLLGLWTIGLLAGAIHPVGFLASVAFLAISGVFYAALGLSMVLRECDPEKAPFEALAPLWAPVVLVAIGFLTAGPLALAWASLLSYEDVEAVIRSGPFSPFGESTLKDLMGARAVVAAWLAAFAIYAVGAVRLVRANERGFDAAVGRPVRPMEREGVVMPPLSSVSATPRAINR